jgi:hypothetical protein
VVGIPPVASGPDAFSKLLALGFFVVVSVEGLQGWEEARWLD